MGFVISPFFVSTCRVDNLRCTATCVSERPAKTVTRSWGCLDDSTVAGIIVPRTYFPRCEANCRACPGGQWKHPSFSPCDEAQESSQESAHASSHAMKTWVSPLLLAMVAIAYFQLIQGAQVP